MPVSLRLAIRQWLARPLRPILCSLAIAAAVTLIVAVGAGFDSLKATFLAASGQMLGRADVHVRSALRGIKSRLPAEVLSKLAARPEVAVTSGRLEAQVALQKGKGDRLWFNAVGVDPGADEQLRPKTYVAGGPLRGAGDIVIDESVAEKLQAHLGDTLQVDGDGGKPRQVRVVGIVSKPQLPMVIHATVFLPLAGLVADAGLPGPAFNVIDVKLKGETSGVAQEQYADKLAGELGKTVSVTPAENRKNIVAKNARNIDFVILIISIIAGISAALIVSTTLSVGVQERLRQFGQLRCVGASRGQMLVFLAADALLLAALGIALGLLIGTLGSRVLIERLPELFLAYRLESKSILQAVGVGAVATAIGGIIPAWQVWRITPMEAVRVTGNAVGRRGVWQAAVIGLCAIVLQILLWQIPYRDTAFWTYFYVGIPLIFAGYCLLAPGLLLLLQHIAAATLGRIVRVQPALLRQAWSRTPWRAAAMIAALMVGVVLYTTIQQRTASLLTAWDFPKTFPDMVLFNPYAHPQASAERLLKSMPEISDAMDMAVVDVPLKERIFGAGGVLEKQRTRFAAVDPDAMGRLIELDFIQGDQKTALARLKQGRAVLVSQEFLNARGKGVGAKLLFERNTGETVEFEIVGVVRSSGIEMAQNYFDIRNAFVDEAVSSVVGTLADARTDFGLRGINSLLLKVNADKRTPAELIAEIRPRIKGIGWQAVSVIEMKQRVAAMLRQIAEALSVIAVAAIAVASLGVANMVIASVQARQFEFGVLRAIGTGRGQLVRMVLAEVTFVSLTAAALGTLAGLHYTFMAGRVESLLVGFVTPFVIWPLGIVIGLLITLLLGWLAAIAPAVRSAYLAQRALLASGRV